jgi:hypothetical protein
VFKVFGEPELDAISIVVHYRCLEEEALEWERSK